MRPGSPAAHQFRAETARPSRTGLWLPFVVAEPLITTRSVGLRSARGPILLSIMLSNGLVAIDSTILATAVPSVVADLGGFNQFPWLFSIYLLAQAVTVPIYGKLSDMVGRKPIMLLGVSLFLLGSVLAGLAWDMPSLIVFRAVQGLGAGAIQPTGMTIAGDIYTLAERAKVQGHLASVWAISAIVGPTLGGLFVDFLNWRWIFYVNVPLGAVAMIFIITRYKESHPREPHRLDVAGAALLAVGGSLLILGLLEGGVLWPWLSTPSLAVLGTGLAALVALVVVERRAAEPVLPGWIFSSRLLNATNVVSLVGGVVVLGLTTYIPLYAQNVLHHTALVAGFALAAMTIGWPIAASQVGRLYLRFGFRTTATIGGSVVTAGALLLTQVRPESSVWFLGIVCFVIGLGMGTTVSPSLIAAQSAYPRATRGTVTGVAMFARSVGSAVGVAVFGTIVNAVLLARLGPNHTDAESAAAEVLDPALHRVFIAAAVAAVVMLTAALWIPKKVEPAQD